MAPVQAIMTCVIKLRQAEEEKRYTLIKNINIKKYFSMI
jgi:hypothetical protein